MNKILKINNVELDHVAVMQMMTTVIKSMVDKKVFRCQLKLRRIIQLDHDIKTTVPYTPRISTEVSVTVDPVDRTVTFAYGPAANHVFTKDFDEIINIAWRFTGTSIYTVEKK